MIYTKMEGVDGNLKVPGQSESVVAEGLRSLSHDCLKGNSDRSGRSGWL